MNARPTVLAALRSAGMSMTATTWAAATATTSFTAALIARRAGSMRSFSILPHLRPTMTPTLSVFRPTLPTTTTTVTSSTLDLVAPSSISRHPALAGLGTQMRCGPRATMERSSRLVQKRRHGFLSRIRTKAGRRTLQRRRSKGRKRLAY